MRAVYLDCFSGISGNMLLGALIDAGIPEDELHSELAKLPIHGYEIVIDRVIKNGISAVYLDVVEHHHHENAHSHGHDHGHHHHEHRNLGDIYEIIDRSSLNEKVKADSKKVFLRLAEAEAKVHGTTIDRVHFHEVGAVDTIIDIVGTVWCLNRLGVEAIYTSKIHAGSGFIKCSHGVMPVPAPATAELLTGIPYYSGTIERELVTPTGAAIIAVLADGYGSQPENFITKKIGYGAGTWDIEIPNVLRLHLGELSHESNDDVLVLEANIDDLSPQIYEYVMDKLFDAGALDVWLKPIIMKKSRPATTLSILLRNADLDNISEILFRETSTIGVRYYQVRRNTAERKIAKVNSLWGQVRVKISTYKGCLCNISPEYDDCKRLAHENGVPLKQVQQMVLEQIKKID